MKIKNLLTTLALTASLSSFASDTLKDVTIKNLPKKYAQFNIAQIQQSFTLKKPSPNDALRINLVVVDLGGSTDMSAKLSVYLVFWKDGEMSNAGSAFRLGDAWALTDYSMLSPTKLRMELKMFDEINGKYGFYNHPYEIDFTEFLKHFNSESETVEEEFVDEWINGSILQRDLRN